MDLSLNTLKEAVSLREHIHTLERRLASLFGGSTPPSPSRASGRRGMSAATRAKLSAAAKANWARRKAGVTSRTNAPKKKGGLTPAGRKKLSDAMKARWAARRRAKTGLK